MDQNKIPPVADRLQELGAQVKTIDPESNVLGYSGVNATFKTDSSIWAEIQVNSPEMIFGKEPESIARQLLGDQTYDDIASRSSVRGGMGHQLYESWRNLNPASQEAQQIAAQSRAYYDAIREAGNVK